MDITTQPWFNAIRRPSRYLGEEIGSIKKDLRAVDIAMVLAFPDVYEVGMSHVGLRILYHILNNEQWIAAERVFAPWPDLEDKLRASNIPLCSLETRTPLASFDIVGFSIQHELCYTNVLNMLDLGGIPLKAREREAKSPLIIAGGPGCFNPEPIADFFDLIVIGDGEQVVLEICGLVRQWKEQGGAKAELLRELRHIKGVYIPSFFKPAHDPSGKLHALEPLYEDYTKVLKANPVDLNSFPAFCGHIVPYAELIHDRLSVEVARGCGRGCRFCQAGFIYRPVRERTAEKIIGAVDEALQKTGYDDLSLLSLSTGDYTSIEYLLTSLMNRHEKEKIALSLPSLRIDSLKGSFLEQIQRVRKTGFTLAVEAGNDRMRAAINKGLVEEEIISMAKTIYRSGWNLIKLYFMVGLPFETDEDVQDIVRLVRLLLKISPKRGRRAHLNISVATFVPKAHTPFMWVPQISLSEARRKINVVREALEGSRARVKWNQPEMSWLEGIFSRGDRRLSSVVELAWAKGARFDAWAEQFNMPLWESVFRQTGIDPEFYFLRQRDPQELLPWDHIKTGITKDFFLSEWNKAANTQSTPDCRVKCSNCGVCDHKKVKPIIADKKIPPAVTSDNGNIDSQGVPTKKYRFTFTKSGVMRYLSHLELNRLITRALRRANIPISYSKGYHPMPKISFASALPVGVESMVETFDLETLEPLDMLDTLRQLNEQLPGGVQITQIQEIPPHDKAPRIAECVYRIRLRNSARLDPLALELYHKQDTFFVVKKTKKGSREINIKECVKAIELISPMELKLALKYDTGLPHLKPQEIIEAIFRLTPGSEEYMDIRKTEQKFIQEIEGMYLHRRRGFHEHRPNN